MTTRIVALGDSTSCGEGVGLHIPSGAIWPARLAAAIPGGELVPLARAGARLRDVRRCQLTAALDAGPDVVTLLIGLNDVSRAGFDAERFRAELTQVTGALRGTGALVVLGRLYDPTFVLPLPPALRTSVLDKVHAVNRAVGDCLDERVRLLDLPALAALRMRRMWDIDRVHPNAAGHALMAAAAARVLRAAGIAVGPVRQPPMPPAPGSVREAAWLVRHGLPWALTHLPQVVAPAVTATVRPDRQTQRV